MVALDLDATRVDSPPRAAALLELSRERLEVRSRKPQSADHGDPLAPAPLRLAADSHDAARCFARGPLAADAFIERAQAVRAARADSCRIDDAIFVGHFSASASVSAALGAHSTLLMRSSLISRQWRS